CHDPGELENTVRFTRRGVYVLRFSANDSQLTSSADVIVEVLDANQPPFVEITTELAWWTSDATIDFPGSIGMIGNVSDAETPNPAFLWSQVSGPGTAAFSGGNTLTPRVYFTEPGVYVLRLTATDSELT